MIITSFSGCIGNIQTTKYIQRFKVSVTSVSNCSLNDHNLSVLLNGSSPAVQFSVDASPFPSSEVDDKVPFFFKVENYPLKIMRTIGGTPYIKWTGNSGTWYVNVNTNLKYEKHYTFVLEFEFNPTQQENGELDIVFYNEDNTWSKTYKLNMWDI